MRNIGRNAYLTVNVLGECWHKTRPTMAKGFPFATLVCKLCGATMYKSNIVLYDYNTWESFGKLSEALGTKNILTIESCRQVFERAWPYYDPDFPTRFADELYKQLKMEE